MAKAKRAQDEPTVIKKYANRRLYDTGRSSYVTLDDLCEMVKDGYDFVVYDAKSNEDITRSVLTQIIVEQESKDNGQNLLPTGFLRKLIGFYGDGVQGLVPNYLEQTLDLFVSNQERMREQINKSFEGMRSMGGMGSIPSMGTMPKMDMFANNPALEEMKRQNMAMFERTMKMFAPFGAAGFGAQGEGSDKDKINELKKNIAEMEKELEKLSA